VYPQLATGAADAGTGMAAARDRSLRHELPNPVVVVLGLAAARVHGARGYLTDHELERDVRDALGGLVYSGTSDIQKNLIARLLRVS